MPTRHGHDTGRDDKQRAAWSFRTRYLALTFGFIGIVVALILTGQFAVLALLLMVAMIYAPRIVAWLERQKAAPRPSEPAPEPEPEPLPAPWGER